MLNHAAAASHVVAASEVRAFATRILERAGYSPTEAADGAYALTWASLRGIDTHGIRNLKRYYIDGIDEGIIVPNARFTIDCETPLAARADGASGLGLAAACWGMRLAIDKAAKTGMGFVAMRNSNHIGAASCYAHMAIEHDMIGLAMTGYFFANGNPVGMPPTFGLTPLLSTNPIAVAAPGGEQFPFVLDMSTSTVPYNRVELYGELGEPLSRGWARVDSGDDTVDPKRATLLWPLGGEGGGHKGYGLAMLVHILTGVLSGGWWHNPERERTHGHPPDDPASYAQQGQSNFFGAIRLDQFGPVDEFKRGMDETIRAVHRSAVEPGRAGGYVAGERARATAPRRRRDGIPVTTELAVELAEVGRLYEVPLEIQPAPSS